MKYILFECGICSRLHPWDFAGDCRDDSNSFDYIEDYALAMDISDMNIIVRSMAQRVAADLEDPNWLHAEEDGWVQDEDSDFWIPEQDT